MVKIKAFKGIRPNTQDAQKIASLPYDVLNTEEARVLGDKNSQSFLHIDKAEIDLAKEVSPYADEVYQKAAENLQTFLQKEWLIKETTEKFYIYELTMNGRSQTGLVVCTSIDDYLNEKIKKHEFTREEKELDRIRHVDTCDANTSPIFLTYRENQGINQLITDWVKEHQALYEFTSFHEVTHRVWEINDTAIIQDLEDLFAAKVPYLYIADGHHRTESAVKVGLQRRQEFPAAPENAEFNYFLSVLFPKEQLDILDYNRVVNVPISVDFLADLAEIFTVTKVGKEIVKPEKAKTIGMYLAGDWYQLEAKSDIISEDPVASLDVSILQEHVLTALFDIQDIRTDKRIDFVGGIRGLGELVELVDSGAYTVAFAMYPTTMEDLLNVADSGQIMPPKSTWFEPKLLSGLFVHDLESSTK
ncbi:DUF1015 domain-containing protein [Carnobacterium gallinarum]|uniref:DUF1015 domain-containing protein n=1 Tax=Carnobacterium gallinarum TaxID=2749 RepID=UPI000556DD8D|nr:DUF1015 family protein [Carnobacterium gallinarum]